MATPKPEPKNEVAGKALAGLGLLAAAAATAAGAYYLYGTKAGAKRRKQIKGWMLKMRGDILEKMEDLKEINEDLYHQVVDTVAAQYERVKNVSPEELAQITAELKGYWSSIQKELAKRQAKPAKETASRKKPVPKKSKRSNKAK